MKNIKSKIKSKGYTLIEVLVAAGIFIAVITIVMAVFTFNVNLQYRSKTISESNQNAKFITESIARDIRLADSFRLDGNKKGITIKYGGETIRYYLKIKNNKTNIEYTNNTRNNGNPVVLNSDFTEIKKFELSGPDFASANDKVQSYVTIKINFNTTIGGKDIEQQDQSIETTVSTRTYSKPGFGDPTIIQ